MATTEHDELLSLPTEADYAAALKAQQAATEAVMRVKSALWKLTKGVDEDETEALPLERPVSHADVGRLYAWLVDARLRAAETQNYLGDAQKALEDLEYLRSVRSDA